MKNEARWLWFAVAGLVLLADLISKQIVIYTLEYSEQIPLLPCLSLTYVENHGAAFSFLSEMGGWQRWLFSGLAILISILLVQWLRRIPASERLLSFAIALVLGGAIGNLVDRIVYGSVIDFILLYYRSWSWPVFNIADSAITLGAAILIVLLVFCKEKRAWFL